MGNGLLGDGINMGMSEVTAGTAGDEFDTEYLTQERQRNEYENGRQSSSHGRAGLRGLAGSRGRSRERSGERSEGALGEGEADPSALQGSETWADALFNCDRAAKQIAYESTHPTELVRRVVRRPKVVLSAHGGGLRVVEESYIVYGERVLSEEEEGLRGVEEEQAETQFNFASQLKGAWVRGGCCW